MGKLSKTLLSFFGVGILALSGCTPYLGRCKYPLIKLSSSIHVEIKGRMSGSCKGGVKRIPTVYSLDSKGNSVKLIIGQREYPILFLVAYDNTGSNLEITSRNVFIHSLSSYYDTEKQRILKETGYLVNYVYDIQKEISNNTLKKTTNNKKWNKFQINIIKDGNIVDRQSIEYKINSLKHFAIESI